MALIAALAATAWVIVLVAAPVLPGPVGAVVYGVGSFICHQIPERSFHIAGFQLPVCARCLGLYAGAAIGVLVWLGSTRAGRARLVPGTAASARVAAAVAAAPTALTLILEWTGTLNPGNVVRALAGVPLAVVAGIVVMNALATLHYDECAPPRPTVPNQPPPST